MDVPLQGLFRQADYDLLLVFDADHFQANLETLD